MDDLLENRHLTINQRQARKKTMKPVLVDDEEFESIRAASAFMKCSESKMRKYIAKKLLMDDKIVKFAKKGD